MKKQRDWYAPRWTHQQLEFDLSKGAIHAKEAIYHASNLLKSNLTSVAFMSFTQFLRRVLPQVDWADAKTVHTGTGLYWGSIDDMLEYVDFCTGHLLEVASWWKKHINDNDAEFTQAAEEKAKLLAVSENPASEAQKGRRVRERGGQSADLHNVSPPQSERASVNGISIRAQKQLDRIARESPAHLAEIQAGTKTIHRAAVELGIVKVKTPLEQALSAFQRLSPEDRVTFMELVGSMMEQGCPPHVGASAPS